MREKCWAPFNLWLTTFRPRVCNNAPVRSAMPWKQESWLQITFASHYGPRGSKLDLFDYHLPVKQRWIIVTCDIQDWKLFCVRADWITIEETIANDTLFLWPNENWFWSALGWILIDGTDLTWPEQTQVKIDVYIACKPGLWSLFTRWLKIKSNEFKSKN